MCIWLSLGDIVCLVSVVLWPKPSTERVQENGNLWTHSVLCTPTYPVHTHKNRNKRKGNNSLTAAELRGRTHPSRCSGYITSHMTTEKTFTYCSSVEVFVDPQLLQTPTVYKRESLKPKLPHCFHNFPSRFNGFQSVLSTNNCRDCPL